ncbi:hypothetical protein [Candidatus Nitrosotalea okcheonensis]|uniref:Uncharacterized protein n=1 Tax=Candidatus Nitrosotalea okcheonensis TaxID=1903276 RepID=A0A2H1FDB2_9ARCH|nr:hypothetical protein [Candidatus Nitrosotalea okcheonensis]SMH70758.1 protein of unknown function [Candidatus Nitrosotalea okcheonensis]
MNHEKKTVNICSELVGYTPISLDIIILNLSKNEQKNYRYYEGEADRQNSEYGEDHRHEHRDGRREHRTGELFDHVKYNKRFGY